MLTGRQIREACDRLGWMRSELARRAGLALSVVKRAEATDGEAVVTAAATAAAGTLAAAMAAAGTDDAIPAHAPYPQVFGPLRQPALSRPDEHAVVPRWMRSSC